MDAVVALRLAAVARALSDPVRFRVYSHIVDSGPGTVCACHLPGQLGISQPTLSHHLKKLVDAEDAKDPLTDQAIVDILKQGGVVIARRTVAKYRDQLGVLSARMRKRV